MAPAAGVPRGQGERPGNFSPEPESSAQSGGLLPGNMVPAAFDALLRRSATITAAFVQAICHHAMATPAHILSLPESRPQGLPPIRSMSSSLVTPYDSRTSAA